jgi:hypothetical protein
MRALCMCLVFALSSCASIDRALKAAFTPPPTNMPSFYTLDEDGYYQYPEGYEPDFTTNFDEYKEQCHTTLLSRHRYRSYDEVTLQLVRKD